MNATVETNTDKTPAPPVTPEQFHRLIEDAEALEDASAIAVAVSGGPDSMALLTLMAEWAGDRDVTLHALTVDHGLRPESDDEAARVGSACNELGIAHCILPWTGEKPRSGVQEAARKARYRLLEGWCTKNGFDVLCLGHTMNDQAETFLMRMSRGSGVAGLAGMPLVAFNEGVRAVRPLLSISKAQLKATLLDRSVEWIEDPSNTDGRFSRVAIRRRLGELERSGISPASVAGAAQIFGRLRANAEKALRNLADKCATVHTTGFAEIRTSAMQDAPTELQANLIAALLVLIGGRDYAPRRARLDRLIDRLVLGEDRTGTLAGCVVSIRHGVVRIVREYQTCRQVLPLQPGLSVWDNRFVLRTKPEFEEGLEIRALGETGWQTVLEWPGARDKFGLAADIPGPVRFGLPAIWRDQNIVEVPHFGLRDPQLSENIVKNVELRHRAPLTAPPFWVA